MRRPVTTTALAGLGALALAAVAGCSSSTTGAASHPTSPTGSASKAATGTTTAAPALVQHPVPLKIPNQPTVRADVQQTSCAAVPGGWGAAGVVRNTAAAARTYTIYVYFTTVHATVVDYAKTTVAVAPKGTASWKASKALVTHQTLLCPMPGISVA